MTNTQDGTRLIKFNRFGIQEDPTHAQVVMPYQGRNLLGDVKGWRLERAPHGGQHVVLDVRHFNGEAWPVQPVATAVRVLVRTFEEISE
jgi:hypothetical protein